MAVKIVSADPKLKTYWATLAHACALKGLAIDRAEAKSKFAPANDLVLTDAASVAALPNDVAAVIVQAGCASEAALRLGVDAPQEQALAERLCARRKRSLLVASSDWAAAFLRRHTGVQATRIICQGVDTDKYFTGRRQIKRSTAVPVVFYEGADAPYQAVAEVLGKAMTFRRFDKAEPEALREGDIWLSLAAAEEPGGHLLEALVTNLVVVGTDVGPLWRSLEGGVALTAQGDGALAWLLPAIGAVVFDWRWAAKTEHVASWVASAWRYQEKLNARDYALKWYGLELFAQKWCEVIEVACKQFALAPEKVKATDKPRPKPKPATVPLLHTEHGVRA